MTTYTPQSKTYTLDLGRVGSIEDLDNLPGILNNTDHMISMLFTDLSLVAADVASLSGSVAPLTSTKLFTPSQFAPPVLEDPYVDDWAGMIPGPIGPQGIRGLQGPSL